MIIGIILDIACAVIGVLALVRVRGRAHGRLAIGAAGVALLFYAVLTVSWRFWITYGYLAAIDPEPSAQEDAIVELHETVLVPIRSISGSLLITAAVVFFVVALVVRGRRDLARPEPSGQPTHVPYGGGQYAPAPHGAAPPHSQQPGTPGPPPRPGGGPPHSQQPATPGPPPQPGAQEAAPYPQHNPPPPPPVDGNR